MRTTLTLDDDVATQVERFRREHKATLKGVVNDILRRGFSATANPTPAKRAFRTHSASLGQCLLPSIDDVSETLAIVEGESFR